MRVSVCMITYNHGLYIRQAIESVLSQEADYEIHLMIGDDGSTDRTKEIVYEYAARFPKIVTIVPRSQHVGMMENFVQTLAACDGDYIAILEGDDFWTEPTKIQQQVDFLENNMEHSICFTMANVQSGTNQQSLLPPKEYRQNNLTIEDLLRTNFIPTCTVLFRSIFITPYTVLHRPLPWWFAHLNMGDYPLHLLNATHGKIGYLPIITACYRVHSGGNFSQRSGIKNNQSVIAMLMTIRPWLPRQYRRRVLSAIKLYYHAMLQMAHQAGRRLEARKYFWRAVGLPNSQRFVTFLDVYQAFLALYIFR